jgi:hypothetical protein
MAERNQRKDAFEAPRRLADTRLCDLFLSTSEAAFMTASARRGGALDSFNNLAVHQPRHTSGDYLLGRVRRGQQAVEYLSVGDGEIRGLRPRAALLQRFPSTRAVPR